MKKLARIMAGNFLIAIAAIYFIESSGFLCGGITGIGLVFKNIFHIPLSYTVFVVNIVMLILAWTILGHTLAASALISSLLYPLLLTIIEYIPYIPRFSDPWINVIFGGGLMGAGIGTVLRAGASSGGMDIPALIVNTKTGIPVSIVLYGMDMVILCAQLAYAPIENLPYSILLVLISSAMVNITMHKKSCVLCPPESFQS